MLPYMFFTKLIKIIVPLVTLAISFHSTAKCSISSDTVGWKQINTNDYYLLAPPSWTIYVYGNTVSMKMDFDFSSALSKVPATHGDTILLDSKNEDPKYKGMLIEIREIGWSEDDCDGLRYDSCFARNFYMQYPNDLVFFKINQWEAKGYKVVFKRTLFATYTTRFVYLIITPYKKQFIIDVYGITDGYDQIADTVIKNIKFKSP